VYTTSTHKSTQAKVEPFCVTCTVISFPAENAAVEIVDLPLSPVFTMYFVPVSDSVVVMARGSDSIEVPFTRKSTKIEEPTGRDVSRSNSIFSVPAYPAANPHSNHFTTVPDGDISN